MKQASRSGRRGARSRTGVARAGRRALSCGSSGGRVGTESGWVAATSNGARVCARAGRDARSFKISRQTVKFLPASLGFKSESARYAWRSLENRENRLAKNERRETSAERQSVNASLVFFSAQKVGGFHRIARASSCLGHVPPRHPFPPPLNPPSTDHLLNTTTSAANATTPPAARNGALSCPEAWT